MGKLYNLFRRYSAKNSQETEAKIKKMCPFCDSDLTASTHGPEESYSYDCGRTVVKTGNEYSSHGMCNNLPESLMWKMH